MMDHAWSAVQRWMWNGSARVAAKITLTASCCLLGTVDPQRGSKPTLKKGLASVNAPPL